ncbi:putative ribonuclease H-like domain-containing protein, partial [Tanacetum coccineum]
MQEEMQQFLNQNVWKLVPLPEGKTAIGTKWILKNKRDARGIVVRNKARLVAKGHRQEEGIDYDEVFTLVARIKAIRLFLAFASYMGFLAYQMDVKSAFLYGEIEEEVYHQGLWYPRDSPFVLEAYSDSDYAGAHGDRKSTTGGCQFLGRRLISWQCKKQTIVATSSTEAEYVAAANCCGQFIVSADRTITPAGNTWFLLLVRCSYWQFWASATVRSLEDGFQELVATVDGNEIIVNESSIRTHLQLDD